MPPVFHWASGICRVPSDLPEQARVCMGLPVEDPDWFWEQVMEGNYNLAEWNAVWGLRALWWYSEEFAAVDAEMLSTVRNLLNLDLINGSFEDCESAALSNGALPPRDGEACLWCDWCRAITMRDRIDIWLDRSGHIGSSYYRAYAQPEDHDIESEWAVVWSGRTYREDQLK